MELLTNMSKLNKIINKIINKNDAKIDNLEVIKNNWENIVGENVKENTEPKYLVKKRLTVVCSSSVWIQELTYHRKRILEDINSLFDSKVVNEIYFRQ